MYKQLFLKLIPKEKSGSANRAVVPAEDLGIQFWDQIYYSRNKILMQHFFSSVFRHRLSCRSKIVCGS